MKDNIGSSSSFGGDKSVICQIWFILSHGAYKCRNKFNYAFVPWQQGGNTSNYSRECRPRGGQCFRRNYGRGGGRGFNDNFPRWEVFKVTLLVSLH